MTRRPHSSPQALDPLAPASPPLPSPAADPLPVAVIGAGPVGLAALAHLVARGLPAVLFEADTRVAASYRDFAHVRLFSPWRYNIDAAARALLQAAGWQAPGDDVLPTAGEVVDRYLAPLAALPALQPAIRLGARVKAISRIGHDKLKSAGRAQAPFLLRIATGSGLREVPARAVIDASGTWGQPNPLGADGLPALGEVEQAHRIRYGMPDVTGAERSRYAGRKVLVVGSGHSAIGNLLALAELADLADLADQTALTGQADGAGRGEVHWAIRGRDLDRALGGGDADQLPARGALGLRLRALLDTGRIALHDGFAIARVADEGEQIAVHAHDPAQPPLRVHEIICATGARPDFLPLRELRLQLDPALESAAALGPLIDPNVHSCGTVRPHGHRELAHPEPGFYIIGAKSYGRAPTFLMATGYEQARSVVAALAGDLGAADEVQLDLPETGVCSLPTAAAEAAPCCPPKRSTACGSTTCSSTLEAGPALEPALSPALEPALDASQAPAPTPADASLSTPQANAFRIEPFDGLDAHATAGSSAGPAIVPASDRAALRTCLQAAGLPVDDLDAQDMRLFLAYREHGRVLGCVGLEAHGRHGLLRSLAVADPLRGRGIGKALVAAAETLARDNGIDMLHLLTTTATRFFSPLGYAPAVRDQAPAAIAASAQFAGICPASADYLQKPLAAAAG
ncbi:MAG: arsenic resistance N-acetyltransferase ArsN2 [Rhodocyclaceae bacterium]